MDRLQSLPVARELVMVPEAPRRAEPVQRAPRGTAAEKSDIRNVQDHVVSQLKAALSVPRLAARVRMSQRNFARVFRDGTG
ncbi:hypothetical protein QTI33_10200 [Variovorax sp. J22P271]|uniref:hypothetical protein n=1 Tax=Variovorax davisae TaxID=3053515 RepID=UPI0025761B27|nr:hypothetical protein [Variovorax sp. J22P271]MDM0032495.1 hypothetical protein [Variovorax sp. J22P271]